MVTLNVAESETAMLLVDRDVLKSQIVLKHKSTSEMCNILSMSENSYYNKLNGKRGFTEGELCILLKLFGKSIFCYDKTKQKGGTE